MFWYYDIRMDHDVHTYSKSKEGNLRYLVMRSRNTTDKNPAIIFIHGGGWFKGGINQHYQMASYFHELGFTCVIPEYRVRLRCKDCSAIDSNLDIEKFLTYILSSKRNIIDVDNIFIVGTSAGGQLALSAANHGKIPQWKPKGGILFAPTLDLSLSKYSMFDGLNQYYSPYEHIDQIDFPLLIFQGKKDNAVDYKTAISFCDKLKIKGNHCNLNLYHEGGHQFFEYSYFNQKKYLSFMKISETFILKQFEEDFCNKKVW